MANSPETLVTMEGIAKRKYGKLEHALPEYNTLAELIPFQDGEKTGEDYQITVMLRRPQGHTHAGGANAGTVYTLGDAINGVYRPARVSSSEYILREQMAIGLASKAAAAGDAAFGAAFDEMMFGMQESATFIREAEILYGQRSWGTIESQSGSSTTRTFVISALTWAPGLWCQAEGMGLDNTTAADLTTLLNTNAVILVTQVDADARTIHVSGNATDLDAAVATTVLLPRSALSGYWAGNSFAGLQKICLNTGTLFNIAADTFGMWKCGGYPSVGGSLGAKLSFGEVMKAIARSVGRGLMGKATMVCSTFGFTDLNNDLAALRRYAENNSGKIELGSTSISYYGPNGGELKIQSHPMIMAGEAYIGQFQHALRSGSSDWTFRPVGQKGVDRFFRELEDKSGFEVKGWWDQFLLLKQPAKFLRIGGIVNSSLS